MNNKQPLFRDKLKVERAPIAWVVYYRALVSNHNLDEKTGNSVLTKAGELWVNSSRFDTREEAVAREQFFHRYHRANTTWTAFIEPVYE